MELDYRYQHTHILGKSEADTTELTKQLFLQDNGRLLLDPLGDLSMDLLGLIDERDLVFFDATDADFPVTINPLHGVPQNQKAQMTDDLVQMFLSLWDYEGFNPTRVVDCLYNSIAALLDYPQGTLPGIKSMLTSRDFRQKVLPHVKNPVVKEYWLSEFETLSDRDRRELIASTRTNMHQLIADPRLRNIIGMPVPKLDFLDAMTKKKTVVVRLAGLSQKKIKLIGSLVMSLLGAANRMNSRSAFHIYVLKPGLFSDSVLMDLLDNAGRCKTSVTLAHRYLNELSDKLVDAVVGTVGTTCYFRLGRKDAEWIEATLDRDLNRIDLDQMAPQTYRITTPSKIPCDVTLKPLRSVSSLSQIRKTTKLSRRLYGKKRQNIEKFMEAKFAGENRAQSKKGWIDL